MLGIVIAISSLYGYTWFVKTRKGESKKVREEQEEWGIKLNEYMERILKDHFEKGEREMANGTRTLAFQVSEEFFQRLKKYLKKTGQSQKEFVIGLIEDVLSQEEHVVSGEMQETEGKAELEETE